MNFDSNKLARALEQSGLKPDAADAIIEAINASQSTLVTKADLEMYQALTDQKFKAMLEQSDLRFDATQAHHEKAIAKAITQQTVAIVSFIIAAIGATAAIVHLIK